MTAVYDAKKLRTMNDEELQLRAAEILRDLFTMRIQGVAKQLMQPHVVRNKRREYARLLTVLKQRRQAAAGEKA
jgi:large subunit ribosomal protein L29